MIVLTVAVYVVNLVTFGLFTEPTLCNDTSDRYALNFMVATNKGETISRGRMMVVDDNFVLLL